MKQTKFTFNSLMIVVIIFTAMLLFVTVKLVALSDVNPVNSFEPIEGTTLAVKYSSLEPDGLYEGSQANAKLVLEGSFGFDWGAVVKEDYLFINEYFKSDLGFVRSDVVKINLKTHQKQILLKNAVLRGQTRSGELVMVNDYILPSNAPQTNSLCKLYRFADFGALGAENRSTVIFMDAESSKVLFQTQTIVAKNFEEQYIQKTLEEIMQ